MRPAPLSCCASIGAALAALCLLFAVDAPPTRAQEAPIAPGTVLIIRGDGDCLRLRAGPSLGSPVLACLPDGSELVALEGSAEGDGYTWQLVDGGSLVGWAATTFLEVVAAPPTTTPTATATATPTPSPTPTPTPTPVPVAPAATGALSGTVPVAGGVGLVVWGGAVEGLAADLGTRGCDFVSAWTNSAGGGFVGYLHGAPAIVNRDWQARYPDGAVPASTPLAVVCRSHASSSATVVVRDAAAPARNIDGIPSAGVGLAVWGGTVEELSAEAGARGCSFVSVWAASSGGGLVGYLRGAPDIVNRQWLAERGSAAVDDGTPVIVVCRGSAAPAPSPSSPPASTPASPGSGPRLREPIPVPPDWASLPPGPAGNE